jgi:hypothetical protein
VFDDAVYLISAFEKSNGTLAFTGPEIGGTIFGSGEGLGIRQADTDLRDMFNKAIEAALADGTIKTLSMKWFKTRRQPQSQVCPPLAILPVAGTLLRQAAAGGAAFHIHLKIGNPALPGTTGRLRHGITSNDRIWPHRLGRAAACGSTC